MEHIEEKEPPNVITSDTDNATIIRPDEAKPEDREKFRHFRAYNTGLWNGKRRRNNELIRHQDNLHRYDSVASSLNLTDYQKKRGRKTLDKLDLRRLGISVDEIIFAICTLVANKDVRDGSRYYPHPEARGDADFMSVADSIGMDRANQISSIEKVRRRTNL